VVPGLRAGAAPGSADDTRDMLLRSLTLRIWSAKAAAPNPRFSDTTLIPPGAQYGATLGKAGKGKPSKYAVFATLGKPLQRLTDHS
jgi:hypothetical protein